MVRHALLALSLVVSGVCGLLAAHAEPAGCSGFKEAMIRGSGDLKPDFVRPLVVTRGAGAGLDQYDLVSQARIDGVLRCRGERFVSFEAKITLPADTALLSRFERAQEVALAAALKWPPPRAQAKIRQMTADAADYLRASEERGDIAVSGKVEEHQPDFVDLGLIWTRSDRTFVVLVGE